MSRKRFFAILFLLSIVFVFIKIYQHNIFIKAIYEKQRLEKKIMKSKNLKNELMVKLFSLKDFERIKKIAQEKFKMQPIKLSQIITVTKKVI